MVQANPYCSRMSSVALRPLRVGEILDAAIKLYVGNARTLMGLTAVVAIPLQALSGIVLLSTVSSGSDLPAGFAGLSSHAATGTDLAARLGASVTLEVTSLIVLAFTTAACVKAVSNAYLGQPATIKASLRFALRRVLPLLAMQILFFLGLVLAFVALVIPGIWLYVSWSLGSPALLIERVGPARALGRSRRLVRGRWWPTAGVLLVAFVMVGVIAGVFEALLAALALTSSHPSVLLAASVVSLAGAVSTIVTQPFQAAVITVLYYDLRVRHEGYDLELLAEQLGLPPAAITPSSSPASDGSGDAPGSSGAGLAEPLGPESVGRPGGPPYWPPPPGWRPTD